MARQGRAQDAKPQASDVQSLEIRFRSERSTAESAGWLKKFSPELVEQADQLAQKGQKALAGGRKIPARQLLAEARRKLPAPPANFPDHVARVFGDPELRHGYWIHQLAYNHDGTMLAGATQEDVDGSLGMVRIWDSGTGRELIAYRGHSKSVLTVAFSHDGKLIVSAGSEPAVRIWDPATGKDVRQIPIAHGHNEKDYIAQCAFGPDGKKLAVATGMIVEIFEVASGQHLRKLEGHTQTVHSIAFSPDGHYLASSSGDHTVRIWDLIGKEETKVIPAHAGVVFQVAFSPDGKSAATCGAGTDKTAKIFLIAKEGQDPLVLQDKTPTIFNCLAFSKDGRTLATGGADRLIRLWDVGTGQIVRTIHGHTNSVSSVVFSPDGTELATAGADPRVRICPVDTVDQQREYLGHQGYVWSAAFNPDGSRIVSASADKTVKIWDAASGSVLFTLTGHTGPVTTASFSPNGKFIVSTGGDRVLRLWSAETGSEIRTFEGHTKAVTCAAFTSDGKQIISGGADRQVKIWNVENGKETGSLPGHKGAITAVAVSSDGKTVATAAADMTVRLWDLTAGKETGSYRVKEVASGLAFSADGRLLAAGGGDSVITIWNVTDPSAKPTQLTGHLGPVASVAFSPNGKYLVSGGSDKLVRIWDATTAQELRSFQGHKDFVSSVAFGPDNRTILSASVDKTIRSWELPGGESAPDFGHQRSVLAVAWSPDGKWIASGGHDRTVRLWDAVSGREKFTLAGHEDLISTLTFSSDGKLLVSGGHDRKLKVWDPMSGKEMKTLTGSTEKVSSVQFAPGDKNVMAWVAGGVVETFDVAQGNLVNTFKSDMDATVLAFSNDGQLVSMADKDGHVRFWALGKGELLGELPVLPKKESVGDMAFTADKKHLVTGEENGEIQIWDLAKRATPTQRIKAHAKRINCIIMSPDGSRFATCGYDNHVKLWETSTGKELRQWDMGFLIYHLAFSPDGRRLATANSTTTIYVLDLP